MQDTEKLVESRAGSYGHPRQNFRRIADGLSWFFQGTGREITVDPEDVPAIMVITKLARDMNKRLNGSINTDDWDDIAGYARTRLMLEEEPPHQAPVGDLTAGLGVYHPDGQFVDLAG